ncbi:LysM peptidoglycan-binding domain-containing protein [Winogradskyella tangerina]|uniref:LysM peptidoglycan-binding domain-containing protein n=1 Tax=Winogradskyella tangerina TaxID=2023240 RepID=UPI000DBE8069|nr:LysM peptidoglycan-binding domain-containing protein [Winogradskyella tangerina]
MQRRYRIRLSVFIALVFGLFSFAQDTSKYKDVLLDGKPAKLNIETGEIILVSDMIKDESVKADSLQMTKVEIKDSVTVKSTSDFHTVQEKETLLDIANKYNTTLTELKRLNNLETTLVDKGQIIRVRELDIETLPEVVEVVEEVEPEAETEEVTSSRTKYMKSSTDFHIVEEDQTLYSISKLYGLTVDALKTNNGLTSNLIIVGQELRIANFNEQIDEDLSTWIVSKGDTLYSIARKNGLTVDELKALNDLSSNLIKVGQTLRLK